MTSSPADMTGQHPLARSLGNGALWIATLFPLFVLLSLLIVFATASPAGAAQEPVCNGNNLLADLQQSKPDVYARLVAEADAVPNGKGLFWKVEKSGSQPSWLLGTMHVTDPRVLVLSPAAREAAASASTVVIESDEILDEKKATAAIMAKPELSMFTDGRSITDFLSDEEVAQLEAGLREHNIPLAAVSRMKPWIIASFVALPACELARKATGASFLDKKIAEDAVAAGKDVRGLETLIEQLTAMSELPVELHLAALIETLALGDQMEDVIETMTQLYLSGDVGMTMPLLKAVTPSGGEGDESAYAAFEKRIVTDRNKVMAERAVPFLEQGNAFVAVGALHLPGEEGLVELLRREGFTVSVVDRP